MGVSLTENARGYSVATIGCWVVAVAITVAGSAWFQLLFGSETQPSSIWVTVAFLPAVVLLSHGCQYVTRILLADDDESGGHDS